MSMNDISYTEKKVSVIIPCYNEEDVISETVKRLLQMCDVVHDIDFELIFIDDGSHDRTRAMLKDVAEHDSRIKVLGFSRNFSHQIAVTAGIDASKGDAIILIDADLQDPPEVIPEMIEKWREGYDVVYGVRSERQGESSFKLYTAHLFYRILNRLSDVPIPFDTGDFRLMSRRVVEILCKMPERNRFLRGMVSWVGFRQCALPYQRHRRFAGVTKYPLKKMLKFATDGILSFSIAPLKVATFLGVTCFFVSLMIILYALILRLFTSIWEPGWTAMIVSITFFGGVQLLCVGILGEYIGRIYDQVKQRPLYILEESVGFDELN